MTTRAAKPKRIHHSDSLDRFVRLKRNYAVRPPGYDEERWSQYKVIARQQEESEEEKAQEKEKRMIREVEKGVKGLQFSGEEMARIIRSWISEGE
ncbi:MAG: hypothetical protein AB1546_04245 [bacterium]